MLTVLFKVFTGESPRCKSNLTIFQNNLQCRRSPHELPAIIRAAFAIWVGGREVPLFVLLFSNSMLEIQFDFGRSTKPKSLCYLCKIKLVHIKNLFVAVSCISMHVRTPM